MLKFPDLSKIKEPPAQKMTLREYAHFSEQCLKSNKAITPENCLLQDRGELQIRIPFRIVHSD